MKPTPAQRRTLKMAAADPMSTLIRPSHGRENLWIADGDEQAFYRSSGPNTDPEMVLNATVMSCLRAGWLEAIESADAAAQKMEPRCLKLTDAGREAIR